MNRLVSVLALAAGCGWAQAPQTPPAPPAMGTPAAPAAKTLAAPPMGTPAPRPDGLYAVLETSMGNITVQLFEKETPLTVSNFVELGKGSKAWKDPKTGAMVRRPLYNDINFYRVMMDGLIQTGDPTGKGDYDCGVTIKDEFRPALKFDKPGRLAMAKFIGAPDSGGCQWFITQASPIPTYDGAFPIFGQVVEGQDVVKTISRVAGAPLPNGGIGPTKPVNLIRVKIERVGPEPAPPAPAKKAAAAAKRSTAPANK